MKQITSLLFLLLISTIVQAQKPKIIVKDWVAYSQGVEISKEEEELEFRFSAFLRKDKAEKSGKLALWARVDKKDRTTGFFQNTLYDKNLKVADQWKKVEIKGVIDKGGKTFRFGVYCDGNGDFYFDSFKLEVKSKGGQWKNIDLSNASFEEDKIKDRWGGGIWSIKNQKTKNFDISYTSKSVHQGKRALHIKGSNIIGNDIRGKFVKVNNIDLYYEIYGEGEPLLMIHGNGQSMGAFMNQIDEFSKHYKVILVDCRGRGNSTFDYNKELTFALQASDIKLFLDKIGINKTHVLGWSDGGIIGLVMAITYPEKIDKLITMGANINPQGIIELNRMINTIARLEKREKSEANDLGIALYKLMVNYPKLEFNDLSVIKSKTLIMAGDKDVIANQHTMKIFEAIKDAQLAILPNETHYFPEQNPNFFNELVLKFLQKQE